MQLVEQLRLHVHGVGGIKLVLYGVNLLSPGMLSPGTWMGVSWRGVEIAGIDAILAVMLAQPRRQQALLRTLLFASLRIVRVLWVRRRPADVVVLIFLICFV